MAYLKRKKTNKRRVLELFIVLTVFGSIVLALVFMDKPVARNTEWVNPNKYSSTELVEKPKIYNGTSLEFTGEAVGERMVRTGLAGQGAWIHLNDDPYMEGGVSGGAPLSGYNSGMSVWVEDVTLTDAIETYGTYKHNGDIVKIAGIYNDACAEHAGDTDIHATTLVVLSKGKPIVDPVNTWKVPVVVILLGLAALMFSLNRRAFRRELLGMFTRRSARD